MTYTDNLVRNDSRRRASAIRYDIYTYIYIYLYIMPIYIISRISQGSDLFTTNRLNVKRLDAARVEHY